jgi:serine/threonine protein kinase
MVRPARLGLGFEPAGGNQKTLLEVQDALGGPGRLLLPYSLRWLLDACAGLSLLHRSLGFVHGEVTPEAVVLGEDGIGRLMPVVRAHWARGEEPTSELLYYLAPERLLGDRIDARADVYSVGVLLWEALTGQRLFQDVQTSEDILARLMAGGIPAAEPLEGEEWTHPLSRIVERALAVDPEKRFSNLSEMKAGIESVALRYLASPPGMAELFRDPGRGARSQTALQGPANSGHIRIPPGLSNAALLDAAADRLARSSFASIDLEDDPPDPEDNAALEAPNSSPNPASTDFGSATRLKTSRPPARSVTPLGPPATLHSLREQRAFPEQLAAEQTRESETGPARVSLTEDSSPNASALLLARPSRELAEFQPLAVASEPPAAAARPTSLTPLIAAEQAPVSGLEPEFDLVRPRHGRTLAIWLVAGAAAAMAVLAVRPWLNAKVASGADGLDETPSGESSPRDQPAPNASALPSARVGAMSAPPSASAPPVALTNSSASAGALATPATSSPSSHIASSAAAAGQRAEQGRKLRSSKAERTPTRAAPPEEAEPADAKPELKAPPSPRVSPVLPVSEGERYGI